MYRLSHSIYSKQASKANVSLPLHQRAGDDDAGLAITLPERPLRDRHWRELPNQKTQHVVSEAKLPFQMNHDKSYNLQ